MLSDAVALRVPLWQQQQEARRDSDSRASRNSRQYLKPRNAHVLAGRSSACFFDSIRDVFTCGRRQRPSSASNTAPREDSAVYNAVGPATAHPEEADGRGRSDTINVDWTQSNGRPLSKLRLLVLQGLLHCLFFSFLFVTFPAVYTIVWLIPAVSREWSLDIARWIGIRSAVAVQNWMELVLQGVCVVLLGTTLIAFVMTATTDPGRIPRRYHWITTAIKCRPTAPLTYVPPSEDRLQIAQALSLGANDLSYFQMLYQSSSFAPALHGGSCSTSPSSAGCEAEGDPLANGLRSAGDDDASIPRSAKQLRIYLSQRTVRVWQALVHGVDDDRLSPLWSGRDLGEEGDYSLLKEFDYEVPTDATGLCDGVRVKLKWCVICQHVRLPRTRHCVSCQSCVDRFDHHCVWVCNCVGLRNHRYFLAFITSASTLNLWVLVLSASLYHEWWTQTFHLIETPSREHWWTRLTSFVHHHWIVMRHIPIPSILLLLAFLLFFPLFNLILFHMVLVASNRTTTEEMRELYLVKNPFDQGFRKNVCSLLFGPVPPSLTTRWGVPKMVDTFRSRGASFQN